MCGHSTANDRLNKPFRGNEAYQRGMAEGMKKFNSSPLDPENNPYTTKENPAEQQNENKNINHLIY